MYSAAEVEQRVIEIVAEELKADIALIQPTTDWYEDLGASLDIVEVLMRCEEEFSIEILNEDAEECSTVGCLIQHIQRKLHLIPED